MATGLGVRFGGVVAVDDVSIEAVPGSVTGLIGPNGAGKTTAINAMSGFVPHSGRVTVGGGEIGGMAPHARARAGLARTWQGVELFDDLTVLENCLVSRERAGIGSLLSDLMNRPNPEAEASARRALARLGLDEVEAELPGELSLGQRKLVGVARALSADPQVLLLDEPAAGLSSAESAEFGQLLIALAVDADLAVLLVDHDMGLVLSACEQIYVLESGHLIASGNPDEIRVDAGVIHAYLGTTGSEVA